MPEQEGNEETSQLSVKSFKPFSYFEKEKPSLIFFMGLVCVYDFVCLNLSESLQWQLNKCETICLISFSVGLNYESYVISHK